MISTMVYVVGIILPKSLPKQSKENIKLFLLLCTTYVGTLLLKIDNMFFLFQAENGLYIKANQKWEKSVEM